MNTEHPKFIEKYAQSGMPDDFDFLLKQGIKLLERLTGNIWTDYNLHDPGITILEQLCFALTDLAYRTQFPIEDLLTSTASEINKNEHAFFDKEKILTSSPITINDFRKVIIDEIDEITNIQIIPIHSNYSESHIKGLYRIIIQVNQAISDKILENSKFEKEILQKVKKSFISKRVLGEDLTRWIEIHKPHKIRIKANILVKEFINPEKILIDIYLKIKALLAPVSKFYSEKELSNNGISIEEIYDGPLLKNGVLPDSELKPMISEIDTMGLIKYINSALGVILVQSIEINNKPAESFTKPYILPENTFPFLDISSFTEDFQLYIGEYRLNTSKSEFHNQISKFENTYEYSHNPSLHLPESHVIKKGIFRNISKYTSIQNNFPAIYGLGEFGISKHESESRKAQMKQLKAYLVLFEQILANYLTQLASLGNLYSTDFNASNLHSYHSNPLYNVPGIKDILLPNATEHEWELFKKDVNNSYNKCINTQQEDITTYRQRKHLIFEHLYARFNKKFSTYPILNYIDLYGGATESKPGLLLEWKADIIKTHAEIEYHRVSAFNYLGDIQVHSGFEKKILKLLHIQDHGKKKINECLR